MSVTIKQFGTLGSGEDVRLFILSAGIYQATCTDYGAILVSLMVPDRNGKVEDVTLGFSSLAGYAGRHPYFGATVGRFANRIGKSRFNLAGRMYRLDANNGENHLHGGIKGFDRRMWNVAIPSSAGNTVIFTRNSPDGEEGYPGNLNVEVSYTLDETGILSIKYLASTDATTIVNLTNHSYFNLKGEGRGNIHGHTINLACSGYVPVGPGLIPVGSIAAVEGTPFDLRTDAVIGERLASIEGGFDHCYVLDRTGSGLVRFAEVKEPVSGRIMRVSTTLPGCQFYSGNFIAGISGKCGSLYEKHSGFCLETQFFPDSPNQPSFPSCVLEPGAVWQHETRYEFSVE